MPASLVAITPFVVVTTGGTLNPTNLILQSSYIDIMALGMPLLIVADTSICRSALVYTPSFVIGVCLSTE